MDSDALSLVPFNDPTLNGDDLLARLAWLRGIVRPRLDRFLGYYRNPTSELAAVLPCSLATSFAVRPFRQFQELGLPARITGFRRAADGAAVATGTIDIQRKEVVIENDIGWRINTLVDFAIGQFPSLVSTANDPALQRVLTQTIRCILSSSGGLALLQQIVLHGAISGSAWIHLRPTSELLERLAAGPIPRKLESAKVGGGASQGGSGPADTVHDPDNTSIGSPVTIGGHPLDVTRWLRLQVVDASRVCPLPHVGEPVNAHGGLAYVALLNGAEANTAGQAAGSILDKVRSWLGRSINMTAAETFSFDLFGPTHWQRYVNGELATQGPNLLGFVPFVRYENHPDPAAGTRVGVAGSGAVDTGISEVEPLIPLQDELNTRLSDRAHRVTMTSFRMYLGKGIEDFTKRPIGPGQMWSTENLQASIENFGGDSATPSEDSHINEVREALDKISGVSPVAAGVIRSKLGNLTSAVALRLTLIALLARTQRKRKALEHTLEQVVRQALDLLDRAGIVRSDPGDRGIAVAWNVALPEDPMDALKEAQVKAGLGVPLPTVLAELGYTELARQDEAQGIVMPPAERQAHPAEAAA